MSEMEISLKYGSHLPILTKVVNLTNGPILELGMGLYSTPFLHFTCYSTKRKLVSFERDPEWFRNFDDCASDFHEINLIKSWDKLPVDNYYDVAFIDQSPGRHRPLTAVKLANFAKYIILHDTEPEFDKYYGYSRIYHLFKYRFDYQETFPHTSIVSNFIDLSNFKI